jgi:hypothetical protein
MRHLYIYDESVRPERNMDSYEDDIDVITDTIPYEPYDIISYEEIHHHEAIYVDIQYITMHDASIRHYTPYMTLETFMRTLHERE